MRVFVLRARSAPTDSKELLDAVGKEAHTEILAHTLMNAIFVASGSGIKTGTKLDSIDNIDLAPTVARLLGISLPDASGRVLAEILHGLD